LSYRVANRSGRFLVPRAGGIGGRLAEAEFG